MILPNPLDFGFSTLVYLILIYIFWLGISHLIRPTEETDNHKKIIWLGAIGLVVAVMGYVFEMRQAFSAIEEAGDVSPALVASAIKDATSQPILGLLCLATSFTFKFILK